MGHYSLHEGVAKRAVVLFATVILALTFLILSCTSDSELSPLEKEAQSIDKSIMCPVCPGETIDQSQVQIAKDLRALIRERLAQGDSREEVISYLAETYRSSGIEILAEPPRKGFSLMVWVVPPIALAGVSLALFLVIRAMSSRKPAQEKEPTEKELSPYLSKVDEELARDTPLQEGVRPSQGKKSISKGTRE